MKKIKLYIVDDHTLFREGLKLLLSNQENISEVYEAENGETFIKTLKDTRPEIALVDIELPGMNGIEATQRALEIYPELKIIALTMYADESYYLGMIEAGARGFLLKNTKFQEVLLAIEEVQVGRNYFSHEILYSILSRLNKKNKTNQRNDLTERETEILKYICKGLSNAEIATHLFISKRTVDKHRENLLLKTHSKNTANLVVYAIRNGYFQI
ncbi:MAG: response regulator transcription factor [Mariniphaga sp.]|nr:response regulator transcription factor [Mariniphaga sp.]